MDTAPRVGDRSALTRRLEFRMLTTECRCKMTTHVLRQMSTRFRLASISVLSGGSCQHARFQTASALLASFAMRPCVCVYLGVCRRQREEKEAAHKRNLDAMIAMMRGSKAKTRVSDAAEEAKDGEGDDDDDDDGDSNVPALASGRGRGSARSSDTRQPGRGAGRGAGTGQNKAEQALYTSALKALEAKRKELLAKKAEASPKPTGDDADAGAEEDVMAITPDQHAVADNAKQDAVAEKPYLEGYVDAACTADDDFEPSARFE
eukprot:5666160-Pleurochrysis_carterae.AAC.2